LKKWSANLESMSKPTEHKTVQARILEYAEAIGWKIVPREEAEERRGGIPAPLRGKVGDRNVPAPFSLFFGGHSCPPITKKWGLENPHSFFNPHGEIDVTKNHLPHWQQGKAWVFVTWRLGDSLPKAKLDQWKNERDSWMAHHPEPWDKKTEAEYHERFSHQIDEWLDQGSGSCLLKDPANASIVAHALRHFDGDRYELASFVVMPNHVHVLFRPLEGHALPEIVKSWKGFTSREINKRAGKTGALWQDEYWDRLIRNEQHFFKVAEYIRENPVKAKLEGGHSCPPFLMLLEKERGLSSPRPIKEKGGQECPPSVLGRLEAKVKTFCAIPQVLAFLKDYIVLAEKN
jgi:type I restriction enzyme R subunit